MLIAGDAQANAKDHGRVAAHDLLERLVRAADTKLLQELLYALLFEELSIPQWVPSQQRTTSRSTSFHTGDERVAILDEIRDGRLAKRWKNRGDLGGATRRY